jgi:hypothetical protein
MNATEATNIEVVRRYFDGCNSGDLELLVSTLAPDVAHYFLPPRFPPITGAEHLAKYWRKYKTVLNPIWSIDHIIAEGDEVVSEWSCIWTPRGTQKCGRGHIGASNHFTVASTYRKNKTKQTQRTAIRTTYPSRSSHSDGRLTRRVRRARSFALLTCKNRYSTPRTLSDEGTHRA